MIGYADMFDNHTDKMPRARKERLVVQDMEHEMLVYDLDTNKAICLNPAARFIWRKCDGRMNISEASGLISKELNIKAPLEFVLLALKELSESNLLDDATNSFQTESHVSRRNLITQFGIPMATLPIVMSLVAPISAQMTSCVPNSQPCTPTGLPCCPGAGSCFGPPAGETCQD